MELIITFGRSRIRSRSHFFFNLQSRMDIPNSNWFATFLFLTRVPAYIVMLSVRVNLVSGESILQYYKNLNILKNYCLYLTANCQSIILKLMSFQVLICLSGTSQTF